MLMENIRKSKHKNNFSIGCYSTRFKDYCSVNLKMLEKNPEANYLVFKRGIRTNFNRDTLFVTFT